MKYTLRPYQEHAVQSTYDAMTKMSGNPCIVLPTGTGKSLVIAQIVHDVVNTWNGRICVIAHRKELLVQNSKKIQSIANVSTGIYSAGLNRRDTNQPCICAGIHSIYNKIGVFNPFDVLIIDEAHLIPIDGDGMYRKFIHDQTQVNPNLKVIGLTATPYRLKGGAICDDENILDYVSYEAGIKEMINSGYLTKMKSKAGNQDAKADMINVDISGGEFVMSQMETAFNDDEIVDAACSDIIDKTRDRNSVLIFCTTIKHAENVVESLQSKTDSRVDIVTGNTNKHDRDKILSGFRLDDENSNLFEARDRIRYLANVGVLTTGYDAPCIDCVVLLRATASPGLYVQMVGRGSRLFAGKTDCLILDYGDNILRHGPVTNIKTSHKKQKSSGKIAERKLAKECPECNTLIDLFYSECPECGYVYPEPGRTPNHDHMSSDEDIMGEPLPPKKYKVLDISYEEHTKRGADESAPKTLRINYMVGMSNRIAEWVCPEHSGWVRERFEMWWLARAKVEGCIPPDTAYDAACRAENELLTPSHILVDHNGKFDEIVDYTWPEKEPEKSEDVFEFSTEVPASWNEYDDDDDDYDDCIIIPF